jgi:hypothetical protein
VTARTATVRPVSALRPAVLGWLCGLFFRTHLGTMYPKTPANQGRRLVKAE